MGEGSGVATSTSVSLYMLAKGLTVHSPLDFQFLIGRKKNFVINYFDAGLDGKSQPAEGFAILSSLGRDKKKKIFLR